MTREQILQVIKQRTEEEQRLRGRMAVLLNSGAILSDEVEEIDCRLKAIDYEVDQLYKCL